MWSQVETDDFGNWLQVLHLTRMGRLSVASVEDKD